MESAPSCREPMDEVYCFASHTFCLCLSQKLLRCVMAVETSNGNKISNLWRERDAHACINVHFVVRWVIIVVLNFIFFEKISCEVSAAHPFSNLTLADTHTLQNIWRLACRDRPYHTVYYVQPVGLGLGWCKLLWFTNNRTRRFDSSERTEFHGCIRNSFSPQFLTARFSISCLPTLPPTLPRRAFSHLQHPGRTAAGHLIPMGIILLFSLELLLRLFAFGLVCCFSRGVFFSPCIVFLFYLFLSFSFIFLLLFSLFLIFVSFFLSFTFSSLTVCLLAKSFPG